LSAEPLDYGEASSALRGAGQSKPERSRRVNVAMWALLSIENNAAIDDDTKCQGRHPENAWFAYA
jgi:hypothetical protein